MPAPLGNTNSADGQRYRKALERALAHKHGSVDDGLFELAKTRVKMAFEGSTETAQAEAAKDIEDRIDGKPAQGVILTGSGEGGAVKLEQVVRTIVDPKHPNA